MSAIRKFAVLIATGLGSGFSPYAPGTCGTLVAIPLFLALSQMPWWLYAVTAAGICALGTWSARIAGDGWGETDDQRIVIDEVAGYLITMAFTKPSISTVIAGFVLFRLFDITKPFPVGYVDRNVKTAFGVMLDDILAGFYGFAAMQLLAHFASGYLTL
jgi:phosphatidylglycerophosphatase A